MFISLFAILLLSVLTLIVISAQTVRTCYVEVAHGGHLGFYEGGFIYPNPVTWLDRTLVAMVGALVFVDSNASKNQLISLM